MSVNHDLFWSKVAKSSGCWEWTAAKTEFPPARLWLWRPDDAPQPPEAS